MSRQLFIFVFFGFAFLIGFIPFTHASQFDITEPSSDNTQPLDSNTTDTWLEQKNTDPLPPEIYPHISFNEVDFFQVENIFNNHNKIHSFIRD